MPTTKQLKKIKKRLDNLKLKCYNKDVKRNKVLIKKGADNYGREENYKERSSRKDVSR